MIVFTIVHNIINNLSIIMSGEALYFCFLHFQCSIFQLSCIMYLHDDNLEIKLVVLYCVVLYCMNIIKKQILKHILTSPFVATSPESG